MKLHLMDQNQEIIKQLDQIEFHDVPVEKLIFSIEHSIQFNVDFSLWKENKDDYIYKSLKFEEIIEIETDGLYLYSNSDLEIYSFDYAYDNLFRCKIHFLCGFGKPSFEVLITCKEIKLEETTLD